MDSIVIAALRDCLSYWIGLKALYAAIVECIDHGISPQGSVVLMDERLPFQGECCVFEATVMVTIRQISCHFRVSRKCPSVTVRLHSNNATGQHPAITM